MQRDSRDPIRIPEHVWRDGATLALCSSDDANGRLRLAKKWGGASNETIGFWTGIDPGEISKRTSANGSKAASPVHSLERWQRIADGLNMPNHARHAAGLADSSMQSATDEDIAPQSLEIIRRIEASDVGPATLEALFDSTDRLCRAYPSTPARELRAKGQERLNQVLTLLDGRTTLTQQRELLVIGGWLALLVGCVEYDLGLVHAAETTRLAARQLGREAGNGAVVGWSYEIAAWMELTQGDYRAAVDNAEAGQIHDRHGSVAVQLAAQEAKGWARLGEIKRMETALDRGRALLDSMPRPEHPEHHFVIDPDKYDFYAMDCYRLAGQDDKAALHAREVVRLGTWPDGTDRSPMRVAEARLTLGVVAAHEGELDEAVDQGISAFTSARKSLPSLLLSARELNKLLADEYPKEQGTQEFVELLSSARRQSRK